MGMLDPLGTGMKVSVDSEKMLHIADELGWTIASWKCYEPSPADAYTELQSCYISFGNTEMSNISVNHYY